MYIPKHFLNVNDEEAIAFMKRYSFGTIVTSDSEVPVANHLPFIVEQRGAELVLLSHFAKANPQANGIEEKDVLVIFSEPHAYISPRHYEKEQSVPTWNYVSVHAYGRCRILFENESKYQLLEKSILTYENEYLKQWNSLSEEFKGKMLNGIVAFELVVTELQAKYKLSQNRTEAEKQSIIEELSTSKDSAAVAIAEYEIESRTMKKLTVIKIGGNVIDNSENLFNFLNDFSAVEGYKILIHGGGKIATDLSHKMGIEPKTVDGRRITDIETLRVVTMVYAGLINKNIVAQLQRFDCNAIGLTGADANLIKASRRPVKDIDYGFVGDLNTESVDSNKLGALLETGVIPVFSAITHDGEGQLLNTNADTIASSIAVAMSASYEVSLVYCFEKKGVLRDVNSDDSVIREISSSEFAGLKADNVIAGGMLPKLENAFKAINNGVSNVYIGKSDELALLNGQLFGTRLFA